MENDKKNMAVARVVRYGTAKIGACERHDERKNDSYGNVNVDPERIPLNIHYKSPPADTYMNSLRLLEDNGTVSTRGLRQDAALFDEMTLDVNTRYFEDHGGYEFAKEFYEEAFHFAEKVYGPENVISAVMHADEINQAVSDELGYPVYHYHLHVVALPVVDKEIRWTRRCKDPALVGTVKEVIHQISHSKKWEFTEPMLDENGDPVLRKNGKPKFIPSYSILQDDFCSYMIEHGFEDFERGVRGSTAEHLSSLQYQIEQDRKRLAEIEAKIEAEQVVFEPVHEIHETFSEIDDMGKKTLTGKVQVSKEDYARLTSLAKEGISGRSVIHDLSDRVEYFRSRYQYATQTIQKLEEDYDRLKEKCQPFLFALKHFPDTVQDFLNKLWELIFEKEREEKEAREERDRKRAADYAERRKKPKGRDER